MRAALLYLSMVAIGVFIEIFVSRLYEAKNKKKKHHFLFARYILLLFFPLLVTTQIIYTYGTVLFKVFLVFMLVGPLLEWSVGAAYYGVVGSRLWEYKTYPINKNTSWLTIPIWGMTGVLFYLLSTA
jgi:hypothetical protein